MENASCDSQLAKSLCRIGPNWLSLKSAYKTSAVGHGTRSLYTQSAGAFRTSTKVCHEYSTTVHSGAPKNRQTDKRKVIGFHQLISINYYGAYTFSAKWLQSSPLSLPQRDSDCATESCLASTPASQPSAARRSIALFRMDKADNTAALVCITPDCNVLVKRVFQNCSETLPNSCTFPLWEKSSDDDDWSWSETLNP